MRIPFWRRSTPATDYTLDNAYKGLRDQVFGAEVREALAGAAGEVWCVVMETGHERAVSTLVAMRDGTASLYFSNGGGILGAGEHEGPARAARALVEEAGRFVALCEREEEHPLPATGNVRFHLLTRDGALATEAPEDDLGHGRHVLTPLFYAAHEVITQIRLLDQGAGANQ